MADCVVACSAKLVGSSSMSVRKVSGIFLFIQDRNLNACLFIYEGVYFEKIYYPIYRAKPALKETSK
jgi:hypothetical protein